MVTICRHYGPFLIGLWILTLCLAVPATAGLAPPQIQAAGYSNDELWFFSQEQELYRVELDNRTEELLDTGAVLGQVYGFSHDGPTAWLLGSRGLAYATGNDSLPFAYALGPWAQDPVADDPHLRRCFRLVEAGSKLLLYGFNDVYSFDSEIRELQYLFHVDENITCLVSFAGYVWFGTLQGLYRWAPGNPVIEEIPPSACGMSAPFGVMAACLTEEGLYIATHGDGLLRLGLAEQSWTVNQEEPFVLQLLRVGEGRLAAVLPRGRLRMFAPRDGWGEVRQLPWQEGSRIVGDDDIIIAYQQGGNAFVTLCGEELQEYYLGRDRLFYRGGGIAGPGPEHPGGVGPGQFSGKTMIAVTAVIFVLLLGLAWWLRWPWRLARLVRSGEIPATELALDEDISVTWEQELSPPLRLRPIEGYRLFFKTAAAGLRSLEEEQEEILREFNAIPPTTREQPGVREEYRGRTAALRDRLEGQQQLIRDEQAHLAREMTELTQAQKQLDRALALIEQRRKQRLLSGGEYRALRRTAQARLKKVWMEQERRKAFQLRAEELVS